MTQPANLAQTVVISPGLQGPPGPSSIVNTTQGYTQPSANGSTGPIAVTNVGPLVTGGPVTLSLAGTYYGTYIVTAISATNGTATFQWLAAGGGVAPNTSVPSGLNVIASTLPGNGVLGTTVVGTSSLIEDADDWGTLAASAVNSIVYVMPGLSTGFGELIDIAVTVDMQSGAGVQTISNASNATPIELTVSGIVGISNGSIVGVTGVLGNTAANGGFVAQSVDNTHINLLQIPSGNNTTGNGNYTSGGILVPEDFGSFTRRGTFRNVFGTLTNCTGTLADVDLTLPAEPANMGASFNVGGGATVTCSLVPASQTVLVEMSNPTAFPIRVAVSGSIARRPIPGAGPVPSITSINGSSNASGSAGGGGTFVLVGIGFTNASIVTFAGVPQTFTVNSNIQITVNSLTGPTPGSGVALGGTGDVDVTTANGTGALINGFTFLPNPISIFGASGLVDWWPNTGIQQSSGTVTSWLGAANATSVPVAGGGPVYNASDSTITPAGPTMTLNGTSDYLSISSVTVGASVATFFWGVFKQASGGGVGQIIMSYHSASVVELQVVNGFPNMMGLAAQNATWGTNETGTLIIATGYSDGAAGASNTANISVGNGSIVSATGSASAGTATGRLDIGFRTGGGASNYKGIMVDCGLAKGTPSTAQRAALESWAKATYGSSL